MRCAINDYNDEIDGYYGARKPNWDRFMFRWFYDHTQYQITFCTKCGNYKDIENGVLRSCCLCNCA